MKAEGLNWEFFGDGYHQNLLLEKRGVCIFESVADDLVTSAAGGIVLRLNYGTNRKYPHELKSLGDKFLLVPRFTGLESEYHSLASTAGRLVERWNLVKLWEALRYPVEELDKIAAATEEEIIVCWLLNSRVPISGFVDLDEYQRLVESSIVATEPSSFELKDFFSRIATGSLSKIPISSRAGQEVTMFVEHDHSVSEWLSVEVTSDCVTLILDDETQVCLT